jgi:hypothetical protein
MIVKCKVNHIEHFGVFKDKLYRVLEKRLKTNIWVINMHNFQGHNPIYYVLNLQDVNEFDSEYFEEISIDELIEKTDF